MLYYAVFSYPGNNKYVADEWFALSQSLFCGSRKGVSILAVDQADGPYRYSYGSFPPGKAVDFICV